jgi:hypothetical protein
MKTSMNLQQRISFMENALKNLKWYMKENLNNLILIVPLNYHIFL